MTLMSANSTHPRRLTAVSSLVKASLKLVQAPLTGPGLLRTASSRLAAFPPSAILVSPQRRFRASLDGHGGSTVTLTSSGMCPRQGGQTGGTVTVTGGAVVRARAVGPPTRHT